MFRKLCYLSNLSMAKLPNIQTLEILCPGVTKILSSSTKLPCPASLSRGLPYPSLQEPTTMSCLLRPSPCPRLALIAPSSRRHPQPQCIEHLLLPPRRQMVRLALGVRMAEMAPMVVSSGPLPEGEPFAEREAVQGSSSREANRWARVEAALNWASKWLVAGSYVFAVFWKHDVEIMWVLLGASANYLLSLILKTMLNHERPAPDLRSDPGMPSSHAQSICYAATLLVLSLYYYLGTNYLTMVLCPATLSMATYLSWLRVSRRLHMPNQVMAGAAVGSAFGALWFVLWRSLVQEALTSSLPAEIVVILGSGASCVTAVVYVSGHWLKNE